MREPVVPDGGPVLLDRARGQRRVVEVDPSPHVAQVVVDPVVDLTLHPDRGRLGEPGVLIGVVAELEDVVVLVGERHLEVGQRGRAGVLGGGVVVVENQVAVQAAGDAVLPGPLAPIGGRVAEQCPVELRPGRCRSGRCRRPPSRLTSAGPSRAGRSRPSRRVRRPPPPARRSRVPRRRCRRPGWARRSPSRPSGRRSGRCRRAIAALRARCRCCGWAGDRRRGAGRSAARGALRRACRPRKRGSGPSRPAAGARARHRSSGAACASGRPYRPARAAPAPSAAILRL